MYVTHKGRKYLMITEHVFHCITHFSCQILSFLQTFVLHTDGLKVDADYTPELGFFFQDFGSKYHNLYKDSLSYVAFFRIPFNGRYRQV